MNQVDLTRDVRAATPSLTTGLRQDALVGASSLLFRGRGSAQPMALQQGDFAIDQPPLEFLLRDEDIRAFLDAENGGAAAATNFGPSGQDKSRNEDAALAACFRVRNQMYAFVSVADGVSTKTFWPERASRLACLTAYRLCRDWASDAGEFSQQWIAQFRSALADQLTASFQNDRAEIMDVATPPDWSPQMFERYKKVDRYWYNTTLIMALIGPAAGVVLWSGDGGVLMQKCYPNRAPVRKSALESGDEVTVINAPSLEGPITLNSARIDLSDGVDEFRLFLCTDGVDRSLARLGNRWLWFDGDQAFPPRAQNLSSLLSGLVGNASCERDNLSVATFAWPPPGQRPAAKRPASQAVEVSREALRAVERLSAIAHRWPRAVAALLLRASKRDARIALASLNRLRTVAGQEWRSVEVEIEALARDPAALNAEMRALRLLKSALEEI